MKIKQNQIIGSIFVIAGIIVAIGTMNLKAKFSFSYPGAKMIPGLSAFLLVLCGTGIFIEGILQKGEDEKYMDVKGVIRMLKVFGTLCLYILGLNYIGFLISTPCMLFILSTMFSNGKAKLVSRVIYALVMTAFIYLVYTYAFSVRMPPFKLF